MRTYRLGHYRIDWGLSTLLLLQALTLFVAVPLNTQYASAHLLLDGCRLGFALVCVTVLTRHRLVQLLLLLSLAVPLIGPVVARHLLLDIGIEVSAGFQHGVIEVAAFCFNAAVTGLVMRHVFGPGRVTVHRIQGAVLIYLNIAALFAIAFNAILMHSPGALVSTTATPLALAQGARTAVLTYFSLATLTTTGYGDIVPVLPLARSLANLEAVIGQLFPATLLARIVALQLEHSRRTPGE